MNRLYARYNRLRAARFIINSLPKSGTNLLKKAVGLLPGVHSSDASNLREEFARPYIGQTIDEAVLLGVGWPRPAPGSLMAEVLDQIRPGQFSSWHVPFSPLAAELIGQRDFKMLLMMRDPRDVCLSHVHHVLERPDYPLYPRYAALSPDERLLTSICGFEPNEDEQRGLRNIDQRCRSILAWAAQPFAHTIYFEKLVGVKGGGTLESQIATLRAIADHLHVRCQRDELERMAERVFGGTATFHKGLIGRWRTEYKEEHKAAFKAVAGPMLIELGYEKDDQW